MLMLDYVGKQLGNYSILRLLGEGGFARVYLGEHIYLKTTAAIKVLYVNLPEHDLQAFLNEARIIARLKHPHIVRVLEFGIDHDQVPFLVMMYAAQGTLRQRHPTGTIVPLAQVVTYVKQVADGLQYAHEQRLIHRDIKPENMLIGRNNEVLLSDFGIAVAAHNTASQQKEEIGGTVVYMAPEQLQGKPRPASDQYSLGCVVYEWLCGKRPFEATNFIGMAVHHLKTPPQPLSEKLPDLPHKVDEVVLKALAKKPDERFPTVAAFAKALEEAYQDTISHDTATTSYTTVPLAPSILPLPAISTLSQVDLSTQTTFTKVDTDTQTASARVDPVVPTFREDVATEQRQGRITRRTMTTALAGIAGLSAIGGGLIWYTTTQRHVPSSPKPAPTPTAPPLTLPARPVGTTLATYSGHTDSVTGVTWSPDRRWLASSSNDKTVRIWPVVGNAQKETFIYTGHTDKVLAVAWSPDNAYVASAGQDKTVWVYDTPYSDREKPGKALFIYRDQSSTSEIAAVAWSPDSKRIASTGSPGSMLQVWDAETGKHIVYYPDPAQNAPAPASGPAGAVAWSPNGLSIVSSIATVSVWNVASGTRLTYSGHGFVIVHGLAWSPDSKYVASAGDDKTVQVWDAATTTLALTYKGHNATVYAVSWSPDGKYLVSGGADKTVQVWEAATGKPIFTYHGHTAPVNAVAWSSDSKHIASSGDDKQVLIWQGA
jgi:serine/threonine protein kinase/WD40 repeat protein